ncbi:Ig-like domain repeat protein [Occultella glacieicola]|uniref:Ig-like domain repeat protein n=1 Tax=Occultella glacieicola TaxID=2518684 RepID=A0ABY2E8H6_9MICO|nr:Ig-like domain-containing protein [Occultella glacieicola]TDE95022.1 Ig-like domain repeat protein [Occultella glacieicola]
MPRLLRLLLAALLVATPLSLATVAPAAEAAEAPRVVTTRLPLATVGTPYSFQLELAGGVGEVTVTVAGGLPDGMTMSPSGLFTGTPTTAGRGPMMQIMVADEADNGGFAEFFFDVDKGDPGLNFSVSPTELEYGQTISLTASTDHPEHTSPLQYFLLTEDGERIRLWCDYGTCTISGLWRGTHVISAETTDTGNWNHETVEHTVVVTGRPSAISGSLVGNHMVVTGPDASIDATVTNIPGGATGTITFTSGEHVLATARLPLTGPVTLDLSALEAGYPHVRGSYSGDTLYEPAEFSIPGPFMVDPMQWVTPEALPTATYSLPYSVALATTEEDATFTLLEGSDLPVGMTFTADGEIGGTPQETGTFTLVVGGNHGVQHLTREFTLAVGERLLDYTVSTSATTMREGLGTLTVTVDPPTGTEFDWQATIVPASYVEETDPEPVTPACAMVHPETSCDVDVSALPAGQYLVTAVPTWLEQGWSVPDLPPLVPLQVTPHLVLTSDDLQLGAGESGRIGLASALPDDATGTVTVAVTPLGGGKRVPAPGEVLCSFDVTEADSCTIPADLTPGLYPLTVTYDGNYGVITAPAQLTVSVAPSAPTPPVDDPDAPAGPPPAQDPGTPSAPEADSASGAEVASRADGRDELEHTGAAPWPLAAVAVALTLAGAALLHRSRQVPTAR